MFYVYTHSAGVLLRISRILDCMYLGSPRNHRLVNTLVSASDQLEWYAEGHLLTAALCGILEVAALLRARKSFLECLLSSKVMHTCIYCTCTLHTCSLGYPVTVSEGYGLCMWGGNIREGSATYGRH